MSEIAIQFVVLSRFTTEDGDASVGELLNAWDMRSSPVFFRASFEFESSVAGGKTSSNILGLLGAWPVSFGTR